MQTEIKDILTCEHINVYEGMCVDCRLYMSSSRMTIDLTDSYSMNNERKQNLHMGKFYEKFKNADGIPETVKTWVQQKAISAPQITHRAGCREQILYAYVYLAYLSLGYEFDPKEIAVELNISKKNIKQGIKLAAGISPICLPQACDDIITAPIVIISPVIYLEEQLKMIKLEKKLKSVRKIAEKALKKNILLYEEKPNIMSLAFIEYYILKKKLNINKIHLIFNITLVSLNLCLEKIKKTFNKI